LGFLCFTQEVHRYDPFRVFFCRERWQAKKWRAKRSNRRTAEQNREGARHSRNFTSSKGCFVNLIVKPCESSFQNRHVSVVDVNDVDDEEGKT
jgi:hypothetical protein